MGTFGDAGCSFRWVNILRSLFFLKKRINMSRDFMQSSVYPWEKFGFGFGMDFLAGFLFLVWDGVFHYLFFHSKSVFGVPLIHVSCWQRSFSACLKSMTQEFPFGRSFHSVDNGLGWLFFWSVTMSPTDWLVTVVVPFGWG